MSPNRITFRRRRPVFVGCEGQSEQAYGQLLRDLIGESTVAIHFQVVLLGAGAGSPEAKIRKALLEIEKFQRQRSKFWKKVVLLDTDIANGAQKQTVDSLAMENGIQIIWQEPCHEAFLLRHLPNCGNLRPPTTAAAESKLRTLWPGYQKPMTRQQLATRINIDQLRQAVAVEPTLASFLHGIGCMS